MPRSVRSDSGPAYRHPPDGRGRGPCLAWHHPSVTDAPIELRVVWDGVDAVPPVPANQFLLQPISTQAEKVDEIVLTAGHLVPPALTGPPDEQRALALALSVISVRPVARVSMTLDRARELRDLLVRVIGEIDERGKSS